MRRFLFLFLPVCLLLAACNDEGRERIRVVGSSTVYPFVSYAAEQFGILTDFGTPVVEATGTGGGIKIFCEGVGPRFPDMANASRQIKPDEVTMCEKAGITDITELSIGFDGIVLANTKASERYSLSIQQVFLALAKLVPEGNGLAPNPYKQWSDIDPALPDVAIEVYGPPPTSGTRDAFVEIVMEMGCKAFAQFETAFPDKKVRMKKCHLLREDGAFVDAGENDNIIVQKLKANPTALGIFGYSFLEQNLTDVQGSIIDDVMPTFDAIASGEYPVARSLYVYVKNQHIGVIPGLTDFLEELTSEDALSEDGYLAPIGLIPLPVEKQEAMRAKVQGLNR